MVDGLVVSVWGPASPSALHVLNWSTECIWPNGNCYT